MPCTRISAHKLHGLLKKSLVHSLHTQANQISKATLFVCSVTVDEPEALPEMPSRVLAVVTKFRHVFRKPTELPPAKESDHHIPLIPGAQPVNLRPYRYSSQQKTEIENHTRKCAWRRCSGHRTWSRWWSGGAREEQRGATLQMYLR